MNGGEKQNSSYTEDFGSMVIRKSPNDFLFLSAISEYQISAQP